MGTPLRGDRHRDVQRRRRRAAAGTTLRRPIRRVSGAPSPAHPCAGTPAGRTRRAAAIACLALVAAAVALGDGTHAAAAEQTLKLSARSDQVGRITLAVRDPAGTAV